MDFVPKNGGEANTQKIAFWTADHCLDFTGVVGAEVFLFDPLRKKHVRMEIELHEFEHYKKGLSLFQARAIAPAEGDLSSAQDLAEFNSAARRNPVQLDGGDLIERGVPACKADTSQYKSLTPGKTAICTTVLDLARLEATIPEVEYKKPEISELLKRMAIDLEAVEETKFAQADALEKANFLTSTQREDYQFFLVNWRLKVSALTRWKRFEAQSGLIEMVRNCADSSREGICAESFRSYFAPAINDYQQWDPLNVGSNIHFRQALKNEVYHEIRQQYPSKHNLKWMLEAQKLRVKEYISLSGRSEFASNFSRVAFNPGKELKAVGEIAPIFFGKLSTQLLFSDKLNTQLIDSLKFNDKSILVSYSKSSGLQSMNYLLQPGDSGSVFLTDSTPIGIVSTVDGVETSGGTSVLPLPDYSEDTSEPVDTDAKGGGPVSRTIDACR